mmetsp:Transcript_11366/g.33730  ORF Transcript_11366/g.33730 Transcript_11366/m.33730 type:complete len:283 (+) Transcript_11366:689-1537(+)
MRLEPALEVAGQGAGRVAGLVPRQADRRGLRRAGGADLLREGGLRGVREVQAGAPPAALVPLDVVLQRGELDRAVAELPGDALAPHGVPHLGVDVRVLRHRRPRGPRSSTLLVHEQPLVRSWVVAWDVRAALRRHDLQNVRPVDALAVQRIEDAGVRQAHGHGPLGPEVHDRVDLRREQVDAPNNVVPIVRHEKDRADIDDPLRRGEARVEPARRVVVAVLDSVARDDVGPPAHRVDNPHAVVRGDGEPGLLAAPHGLDGLLRVVREDTGGAGGQRAGGPPG